MEDHSLLDGNAAIAALNADAEDEVRDRLQSPIDTKMVAAAAYGRPVKEVQPATRRDTVPATTTRRTTTAISESPP